MQSGSTMTDESISAPAEIAALLAGANAELPQIVERGEGASRARVGIGLRAMGASVLLHAGTAWAALYLWNDVGPDLLALQRGVAAIELVASIDMVEQSIEAEETPLEIEPEPVPTEPMPPIVEAPRTETSVDVRPLVAMPNDSAAPPPPTQPRKPTTEETLAATPPPPQLKRTTRSVELPVETVQVDSVATPMSAANEGIDTPDELPRQASNNRPPSYPLEALSANIEGVVTVRATIDAAGSVAEVELSQSSGTESLDRAALVAVRGWRFAPGRKAGLAIKTVVLVPVRFTIRRG